MERMQKTYQAVNFMQLDTYIVVKGTKLPINFRGGSLDPKRNGTFTTSDPDVIEALDNDSGLNKTFKLVHSDTLLDDIVAGSDWKEVREITTVSAAREYLVKASEAGEITKGITSAAMKNRSQVIAIADNEKIRFVDLPKI